MAFQYLPGIFEDKQDGNLTVVNSNDNPVVCIIGTAGQGDSEDLHNVVRIKDSAREYGKLGTLTRGMYEASIGGALNLRLFRIGATSATLATDFGLTIETVGKDDSMGTDYILYWDDSALRLRVYRVSDDELVYDNYPSSPDDRVDLNEVAVTGTATTNGGTDWGAAPGGSTKTLADLGSEAGFTYTAGTDGLSLSRMETYEKLYDAYKLLEHQVLDVVVPMNVYLDDLNVMDMNAATISGLALTGLSTYPVAGETNDVLGKVYVEEVNGENLFWWWFPDEPAAASPAFTAAQIYPSGLSMTATEKGDGTTSLTASDFHEVNFAYQLANFCYTQANENRDMTGVIGVLPPNSFTLKDVSRWIGELPTTAVDANGKTVVSSNGTGLLGNKWVSGRISSGGSTGTPGHTVDGVDGLYNGGFIATDDGWVDGTQLTDDNDHLVDIGKYISLVAVYPVLSNPSRTSSYTANGAATYAGFYSVLPPNSAPTNKQLGSLRLPYRVNMAKLDLLAGRRYVTFHAKPRGIVVSDAPVAARPDSDYQRLSTMRQVKAAVDDLRRVAEPFLGEAMTGAQMAALNTAIDQSLASMVKAQVLNRYEFLLSATPQQRVLGQATVDLKLVPAFELRQITVSVALAAA